MEGRCKHHQNLRNLNTTAQHSTQRKRMEDGRYRFESPMASGPIQPCEASAICGWGRKGPEQADTSLVRDACGIWAQGLGLPSSPVAKRDPTSAVSAVQTLFLSQRRCF